jgi:hypothetical protein
MSSAYDANNGNFSSPSSASESRSRDVRQLADFAHLIHVDAEVGAGADQAIGVGGGEAVFGDEPIHQVEGGGFDSGFEGFVGVDRDEGVGFFDTHEGSISQVGLVILDAADVWLVQVNGKRKTCDTDF